MDYSQFFNMLPEATLMAVLVIVFLADLILKGDKKHATLSLLAGILLAAQTAVCFIAPPRRRSRDCMRPRRPPM